jgi:hypothetical protein
MKVNGIPISQYSSEKLEEMLSSKGVSNKVKQKIHNHLAKN